MRCPNCGHVITRSQQASNYFHKLRDLYASATGLDNNHAKVDLKLLYGVVFDIQGPADVYKVPTDTPGEFVEIHGKLYWLKSEAAMTKEEHNRLIEGSERACLDVGAELPV